MIQVNELRVGNVLYNSEDRPLAVASILRWLNTCYMHTMDENEIEEVNIKTLSGIPLTSEIMEACGFEKTTFKGEGEWYWSKRRPYSITPFLLTQLNGFFVMDRQTGVCYSFGRTIEYLHQLQNLYFDHEGEELEIKL